MASRARHLSLRVPWHDAAWNGSVCRDPSANCHCIELTNIGARRELAVEIRQAGTPFSAMGNPADLPPCHDESGGFLSPRAWGMRHEHPYRNWSAIADTHGHLLPTDWTVEPYTAQAVPFRWMSHKELDSFVAPQLVEPLPPDNPPSAYTSDWVFWPEVQEQILDGFFRAVQPNRSLAFFYTKSRQPLFDDIRRLVVGVGMVTSVGQTRYYRSAREDRRPHPIWQRDIGHSLRPGGIGGFLVPYHDYLATTGDLAEDARRIDLARELRIVPDREHMVEFSYRSEHVSDDATVSVLTQAIRVVGLVRNHGIALGDWAASESWLNEKLADAWKLRGRFPGIGAVLEAAGLPMATSLVHLMDSTDPGFSANPWRAVERVFDGSVPPPAPRFEKEIDAFAKEWVTLSNSPTRLALAKELSRLSLTAAQAKRWFEPGIRYKTTHRTIDDVTLTNNLYLVSEFDRSPDGSPRVGFPAVDRAVIGDGAGGSELAANDATRLRAALTAVLRDCERDGDTLLSIEHARQLALDLPVSTPVEIGPLWVGSHVDDLDGVINVDSEWIQLVERAETAFRLRKVLEARANRDAPAVAEDWKPLLQDAVASRTPGYDPTTPRNAAALAEQSKALEVITSRKLTVLVGRAGTGKTTVIGALSRSSNLGPVLFLAPTGKARVRLQRSVLPGTAVMTVAQFLFEQGAYNGERQEPEVLGPNKGTYDGHRTVVIDECSMLTEETLLAVLSTFSPEVMRLVLVGDPAQLPPIGPGRPFADLVAHLSGEITFPDDDPVQVARRRGAHARLRQEVRSVEGDDSDALRFASHFSGDPRIDAESIIGDITAGSPMNDLSVRFWATEDELHDALTSVMREYLEVEPGDVAPFNAWLGIEPGPDGPEVRTVDGAESWQILSPVRANTWGVEDLNRWVQQTWRGKELRKARQRGNNWVDPFGPQEIIRLDKVMLTSNRKGHRGFIEAEHRSITEYLANGEIGLCSNDRRTDARARIKRGQVMDIAFAGRPDATFGFFRSDFGNGETGAGIIELAYALTIHKAQGSDFGIVIVVLPRHTSLASRELLYTALTRSRDRLVLLVEGSDLAAVLSLRSADASATVNRNTNLFRTSVRGVPGRPFAQHLIHRASDGQVLKSKSELIIWERCLEAGLAPSYETPFWSLNGDGTWKEPDFTFIDPAGDRIIWEHLGMLDLTAYADGWERKKAWYQANGVTEGDNLFVTTERGGFDTAQVTAVIDQIKQLV